MGGCVGGWVWRCVGVGGWVGVWVLVGGCGGVSVGHDLILLDRNSHKRAEGHSKCAMIWADHGPYSNT